MTELQTADKSSASLADSDQDERDARALQPLGKYSWPSMPTEDVFRRFLGRLYVIVKGGKDSPYIADDQLHKAKLKLLDDVVSPPACGPAIEDLELTISEWRQEERGSHLKVVVVPPCDQNGIVDAWAEQQGHQILTPPSRMSLVTELQVDAPDLRGDDLLVIPRLEHWFLRHRNGLAPIRQLLSSLYSTDRPCLIGCNSWAWAYLAKAVESDLILPEPVTFQPFGAERLWHWLGDLATAEETSQLRFRFTKSGKAVFSDKDSEEPELEEPDLDYFRRLAAHSLGIPWVAWHLWRRSLFTDAERRGSEESEDESPEQDLEILWVGALDEMLLPNDHPQTALLVMQALLIHGPLTTEALGNVVPVVGESNVVPALLNSGFLDRKADTVMCRAAAYSSIRSALADAGFSMDKL